jgi:hypothetical protein
LKVEKAVSIMINAKECISPRVPFGCKETSIFLIDTSKLKHVDNVRSHELGAFKNERVQRDHVSVSNDKEVIKKIKKSPSVSRKGIYLLKRSYYSLRSDPSFKRRIYELFDWQGNQHNITILQFIYHGKNPPPKPAAHGNSKTGGIYVRTAKSTVEKIDPSMKAKDAFEDAFDSVGGLKADSMCSIPRNIKQVYNIKQTKPKYSKVSKEKDDLYSIIEQCKAEQSLSNPFIRSIQAAPEPMCVCVTDRQLSEMEKFLTNPGETSVLGIDPTFNLGQFLVTVATYKHLQLRHRRTGNSPTMIGPVLIHQKKLPTSYSYLASTCSSLQPSLSEILFVGTDDEKAIFNGVKNFFPQSQNIQCFRHMRNNISRKLKDIGMPDAATSEYIKDIFGVNCGLNKQHGLVDSTSEDEFDTELKNYEIIWNEREISERKTSQPVFHTWFKQNKADTFKKHLLLPLRISAGLGFGEYTTNANESINKKLKEKVDYKESQIGEFCNKLFSLIDYQNKDVEKALIGAGPYELRPEYKEFEICQSDWFKLSNSTRQQHVKHFLKAPLKPSRPSVDDEGASTSSFPGASLPKISISLEDTGLPKNIFQNIWEKASEILEKDNNVVQAPGDEKSAMLVVSKSGKMPHYVEIFQSGKIECPCDGYKSKKMCSHAIAVAEKSGLLSKYLRWYEKCGGVNITSLSMGGMPNRPQKKPGYKVRPTKRKPTARYDDLTVSKRRSQYTENERSSSLAEDFESNYFLKCLKGTHVRVCYGCTKAIRVPPYVPPPPYDIVICRKEFRAYSQDGVTKLTLTPQNVHYHVSKTCIMRKNPEFNENTVIICPEEVNNFLQDIHRNHLKSFNVKY